MRGGWLAFGRHGGMCRTLLDEEVKEMDTRTRGDRRTMSAQFTRIPKSLLISIQREYGRGVF